MKKLSTKIGTTAIILNVPESIEEFDQAHGRAGAVLDKAIQYDVAHTILSKIRVKVGAHLEKRGAPRDVERTDDKGEPVYKPIDTKWIARSFAKLGIDAAGQAELFQSIADEVGYDVSGTRSSNKEYNQVDIKDAKALLEAVKLGRTTLLRIVTNLQARNPGLTVEVTGEGDEIEVTVEALAAGLKVERARVEAERQASLF
jgi:hypothetical protein